jgi:hypothetical protein
MINQQPPARLTREPKGWGSGGPGTEPGIPSAEGALQYLPPVLVLSEMSVCASPGERRLHAPRVWRSPLLFREGEVRLVYCAVR